MKKALLVIIIIIAVMFMISCENTTNPMDSNAQITGERSLAKKGGVPANDGCTTIQSGELVTSTGEVIETGYDIYGYNYQAHMFIGLYGNYSRPPVPEEDDYKLIMKWNDAWLSNMDCDDDGLLDRHYGFDSYIGSGAWLTNHMSGEYFDENGKKCHWTYFVKIVAAPEDAYAEGGVWYNADGTEIGPVIWGSFAIIQEVENDPCAGIHGLQYGSPDHAGLGNW